MTSRTRRAPLAAGAYGPGDLIAGRYEVKSVIGEGPVGVVYRARDREVDVQVAVKVLNSKLLQAPEEKKIFQREARIARALSHKNVIRLYDEGFDGPHPYVVTQYLEGLTLRKIIDLRVDKGGTFPIGEIEPILHQLLDALDYAHDQRGTDGQPVAHTDLRPSNVIVLPDLLKVADFRQALMVPRVPFVAAQKVRGADAGYLAPEVVAGEPVTPAADFYSVGVLLGEMLTGRIYDPTVGLELHVENDEVPVAFTSIFKRLTADKPRDRYSKIPHLLTDLALAADGQAPKHVGAFRAQVTRAERVDSDQLQVLHTGEFEALDGSEPKEMPQPPPGRRRESFGLETPAGMPAEAPPLEDEEIEDDEVVLGRSRGISDPRRRKQGGADEEEELLGEDDVLEEELLDDDEAFSDDEYEDDEYEEDEYEEDAAPTMQAPPVAMDEEEALGDEDILEEELPTGEGQAYPEPATRPAAPGLELILQKRAAGGPAALEDRDEPATMPKAASIETLLSDDSVDAPPVLDDLLAAAHDLPEAGPNDTDPQARSLGPPIEQTGPIQIGSPPPARPGARPGARGARPSTASTAAIGPRKREKSWVTPALVAVGVIVGLGLLVAFTEQGRSLWSGMAKQPIAADEPDTGPALPETGPSGFSDPAARSGAVLATDPTPEKPEAPAVEPRLAPVPGADADEGPGMRAEPSRGGGESAGRTARERREAAAAAKAERRAEAEARRQAEAEERRRAAEAREAEDVRKKAEQDAQMAQIIEQERRRQEAERARRTGESPSGGSTSGGSPSGGSSSPFSFDTVDREMPVRKVGPEPDPPPEKTSEPLDEAISPARPLVASAEPPAEADDARCPKGMVYVPGGGFPFGSAANDPMRNFAEKTLQQVQVVGFCIDRFEYGGQKPSTAVSWFRAKELCERRSKRLCTEEEWEKACKGPQGRRFPYGNSFDAEACNTEDAEGNDRELVKSGAFRRCRSGYGVYDMAGNAAEWTSSTFQTGAAYRTIKGGAANRPDWDTRCATRGNRKPNSKDDFLGFRCCARPQ
ncbi:MAG: SUMF1/EgtB/PvdO family nonheme iron enzyme [Deltaproteobacteria bacterium]|nr:SUMF1/EgtB/PvdO family nonheme iron enzyme [Deltaproteobacteria bacterium]